MRAVEDLPGGVSPLARIVNLIRVFFDDRHVVQGVVVKLYFVKVAYYVPPRYEV